jgi:hypothetical protein
MMRQSSMIDEPLALKAQNPPTVFQYPAGFSRVIGLARRL